MILLQALILTTSSVQWLGWVLSAICTTRQGVRIYKHWQAGGARTLRRGPRDQGVCCFSSVWIKMEYISSASLRTYMWFNQGLKHHLINVLQTECIIIKCGTDLMIVWVWICLTYRNGLWKTWLVSGDIHWRIVSVFLWDCQLKYLSNVLYFTSRETESVICDL